MARGHALCLHHPSVACLCCCNAVVPQPILHTCILAGNRNKAGRLFWPTQVPVAGLQAYKNGVQGLSVSASGLLQLTDVVMGDNGAGPRTLTIYNTTSANGAWNNNSTTNSSGSNMKLAGGNVEFGQVRRGMCVHAQVVCCEGLAPGCARWSPTHFVTPPLDHGSATCGSSTCIPYARVRTHTCPPARPPAHTHACTHARLVDVRIIMVHCV